MQKFYKPTRVAVIFVIMALLAALYMSTLYKLQLYDSGSDENAWQAIDTTTQTITLTANRGDILDRNGEPLVSTRPVYNITLSRETLLDRVDINEILLKLIHMAVDNGIDYTDTFPVTIGAPFSYLYDMTDTQKDNLKAYLDYFDIDADISASDLIVTMKEHYGLDYTTNISDARLVIGVRYEMEMRPIKSMNPYIFASDIGVDFLTLVKTQPFPGVNIETGAQRVYHTPYAAHLLGYTGKMNSVEYNDVYKPLGYSYNAIVGKDGAEKAFEQFLHGSDGTQAIATSDNGTVMDVKTIKEPIPGENVFLSIDIGLQAVCEEALAEKIDTINADPERSDEDKVTGGAVVVVDVHTGEVLASCSYPTYDLSNVSRNYSDLMNDPTKPLFNRALNGIYLPGSTFKMVTALTGLRTGTITPASTYYDSGQFKEYIEEDPNFHPSCWIYNQSGVGHGEENVVTALRDSCNVFFYWLGDKVGNDALVATARDFGLGAKTGIELPDSKGILADWNWKKNNMPSDAGWWAGDTVYAAIGQAYSHFTPIQLANYVATIANGGTHYNLTMLSAIRSADFTSVVYQPQPKELNRIVGSEWISYLQQGMKLVAKEGTAKTVFKDFPIPVAAKTGTVQLSTTMGNEKLNNGVFVCYAPADDPEIAISLVVEKGTSGSTIMEIAREIMKYYFNEGVSPMVIEDNAILP
jgi:penicillin-binding protein 2